jgi:hypothetical protein
MRFYFPEAVFIFLGGTNLMEGWGGTSAMEKCIHGQLAAKPGALLAGSGLH